MKFSFFTDDVLQLKTDLLGLLCFEDKLGTADGTIVSALNRALDGLLLHTHGRVGSARILLVGAGPRSDFQAPELRAFAARVVKAGTSASVKDVTVVLPYL